MKMNKKDTSPTLLVFQNGRQFGLQASSRDTDLINDVFAYESPPVPTSIFF